MKRSILAIGASAIALMAGTAAQAGTLWIAQLSGANENPPTTATFTGTGFLIVNDAENLGTVYATHNINIPLTGGHLHTGTATVNGPVFFPFPAPASPVGPLSQALTAANITALKSQGVYMNFHTAVNPGGAIRGTLNRSLLSTSATTESQMAVANALDVSAGYNAELDGILMAKAVSANADRTDTLDALSGHTLYADGRQAVETMIDVQDVLFNQATAPGGGFFASAGEAYGKRDGQPGAAGSKVSRPSLLIGFDSGAGNAVRGGVAVGYAAGKDDFSSGAGRTEAKTTSGHAFLSIGGEMAQFTASLGYGKSKFDTSRNLSTLGRVATSSHDGSVWSAAAKISGPVAADRTSFSPYALVDMQSASIDAYTEAGAGTVGLIVPKHKEKSSALEGGVTMTVPVMGGDSGLTARVQAGWRYNIEKDGTALSTAFVGSPVAFTTLIDSPARNVAHIAASITGQVSPNVTASAGYRGYISGHSDVHMLQVRIALAM